MLDQTAAPTNGAARLAVVAVMPVMAARGRAGAVRADFIETETARAVGVDPAERAGLRRGGGGMIAPAVMRRAVVPAEPAVTPAMGGGAGAGQRDADQQRAQE